MGRRRKKKDPVFREPNFEASCLGPLQGPGVYAICVVKDTYYPAQGKEMRVVYIGSAKNIKRRVLHPSHPYRRLYSILKSYWVTCFWVETKDYLALEKALIKKYRPRLNIVHNG